MPVYSEKTNRTVELAPRYVCINGRRKPHYLLENPVREQSSPLWES